MSGETVVTIVGNLVGDPSCGAPLRESRSQIPLRRTSRGFLDRASGTWKDGDAVFLRARLWRHRAENAAETLHDEGMRVTSSVDGSESSVDGSESGLPGSPRARSGPRSRSRRSDFPSGTPPPPSAMWPGQLAAVLLPGASRVGRAADLTPDWELGPHRLLVRHRRSRPKRGGDRAARTPGGQGRSAGRSRGRAAGRRRCPRDAARGWGFRCTGWAGQVGRPSPRAPGWRSAGRQFPGCRRGSGSCRAAVRSSVPAAAARRPRRRGTPGRGRRR